MEETGSSDRHTEASLQSEGLRTSAGISPANPKLWTTQVDKLILTIGGIGCGRRERSRDSSGVADDKCSVEVANELYIAR